MAVTQSTHTGNGSNVSFGFTFPYLKTTDVKITVDGAANTAWSFTNATTVQFNTAPANGAAIVIYRDTANDSSQATFYAGSAIKSTDLNDNFTQTLYSVQEIDNNAISTIGDKTMAGNLNLGNYKAVNVADPTAAQDAVTKAYLERTGSITSTQIADGTIVTADLADNSVSTAKIIADAVTGAKIADDQIDSEHYVAASIDTEHIKDAQVTTAKIADLNVTTAKIAADAVNGTKIADDSIDSEHYVDGSIDTAHIGDLQVTTGKLAADAITGAKIGDDQINSEHYVDGSIDTAHIADLQVTTAKLANTSVSTAKIAADAIDGTKIADNAIDSEHYVDGSIDTAHIGDSQVTTAKIADANVTTAKIADVNVTTAKVADANITTAKIADSAVTTAKIPDDAITTAKIADAELSTLAGMQSGTASKLADSTALTADIADLNQIDGMAKQTTITDDDTKFPTSGAVVDYFASAIQPFGGIETIATETNFPSPQPASGVVISISDAGGVVFNGSGVATITNGAGSGNNVTINSAPSSLYSETLVAGVGLMVTSTGSGHTYTYHKILGKEDDIKQLSDDINDFNARYRVASSAPGSNNDAGDMYFDTTANKMKVYNGTTSTWDDVASVGNFFINTISSSSGTGGGSATFNGSAYRFTLSNAPTMAQQLIVSVNGVIQKPNAGSSQPSEGFAISGSDILFSAAPASGSDYFIVTQGSSVSIGTPSDNTVATAKIQNQAVTSTKIADGTIVNADINASAAITGSKLADDSIVEAKLDIHQAPADGKYLKYTSSNGMEWADGASEGTDVKSTGESGTAKFLRVDGDGTSSWQVPPDNDTVYTHPNHSGEVTSTADGATVITDNIVDEANLKVSNAPTNGQFLQAQSGNTGGLTWADVPAGAGTYSATADGAIANGVPIIATSAGKVKSITAESAATGAEAQWSDDPLDSVKTMCTFIGNSRFLITWRNTSNNYLYGCIATMDPSNNTVSHGTEFIVYAQYVEYVSVASDENGGFLIGFSRLSNDYGYTRFGTCGSSGNSVAWGSTRVFRSANTFAIDIIYAKDTGRFWVGYKAHTTGKSKAAPVISGDVDLQNEVEYAGGGQVDRMGAQKGRGCYDSANDKVISTFSDSGDSYKFKAVVIDVPNSQNDATFGTEVVICSSPAQVEYSIAVFDTKNNKVIVIATPTNYQKMYAFIGTVDASNNSISFLDGIVLDSSTISVMDAVYDDANHILWIIHAATGGDRYPRLQEYTINADTTGFTLSSTTVLESDGKDDAVGLGWDPVNKKLLCTFQDSGDGVARVFSPSSTDLTTENYIGFSAAAYSDGNTATVNIVGSVDENQSSLTPGKTYYVQRNGSLATTAQDPSVVAGTAVAATKILIKG